MPPHLHPRSRMTSSLFATTVAASFLVVGLPHLLPCPAPRVAYADAANAAAAADGSSNRRRTRRRSQQTTEVKDGIAQFDGVSNTGGKSSIGSLEEDGEDKERGNNSSTTEKLAAITMTPPRAKRECPVPKPPGVIGQLMGFKAKEGPTSRDVEEAAATREHDTNRITPNNQR
ncbi:hypothetical protein F5Y08DRAFT_91061 [Xylaria arbuscula]|nr:hypothetical protein F5Y08DRAFT_91061 [Xylaria arbuscula]